MNKQSDNKREDIDNIVLISDPQVLAMPIIEIGDELIDISLVPELTTRLRSYDPSPYFKLRKQVVDRLIEAQRHLPSGARLLIIEGHRPQATQKNYFDLYVKELQQIHPDWDGQRYYLEASKFVAPPESIPPHSTGGAVDLTIINANGADIDMGTIINENPEKSANACFTYADNITEAAKRNRKILIQVMSSSGFINYPTEWWHWSYGDRYWAYSTGAPNALYTSV